MHEDPLDIEGFPGRGYPFMGVVVGDRVRLALRVGRPGVTYAVIAKPSASTAQVSGGVFVADVIGRYTVRLTAPDATRSSGIDVRDLHLVAVSQAVCDGMRRRFGKSHGEWSDAKRRQIIATVAPRLTDAQLADWEAHPGSEPIPFANFGGGFDNSLTEG